MKKRTTLSMIATFFITITNAQNVNIPDANFKTYLVGNSAINTNADSEIQVSEAQAFNGAIYAYNKNIADMTGIESFTSLTELYCGANLFTSLDVSNNITLVILNCASGGTGVINSINTNNCTALTDFRCMSNQITSIDISSNTSLTYLDCSSNNLNSLNVANGNNTNFTRIYAYNNTNLNCVKVDNAAYSTANWTGGNFDFPLGVTFSEICSGSTSINEKDSTHILINIYPNPTSSLINITCSEATAISITNVLGQQLILKNVKTAESIDVSNFENGIYFIKDLNSGKTIKFIKQ